MWQPEPVGALQGIIQGTTYLQLYVGGGGGCTIPDVHNLKNKDKLYVHFAYTECSEKCFKNPSHMISTYDASKTSRRLNRQDIKHDNIIQKEESDH